MGQRLEQRMTIEITTLPPQNWSLVNAFEQDAANGFNFPLNAKRGKLEGLESLDHEEQMRRIDEENSLFRFAYVRGTNSETGNESGYFKVPLLRNRNVEINDIKKRITKAEYERATAVLACVGSMERIAHAIPYHGLLVTVRDHLRATYNVGLEETVVVAVDRGGRLPAIILAKALNHSQVLTLKVDQGGGRLDEDRLDEFEANGSLQGKHVLFVDSTVDSGRQIDVLRTYFDNPPNKTTLGFKSWSIVGSNEDGECLYNHLDINWGVDPDQTFEDNPLLMGIDYAPGNYSKVVEKPSETSEKIRQVILDVPAGFAYDLANIDEQLVEYKKKLAEHEKEVAAVEKRNTLLETANHEIDRALRSDVWVKAARATNTHAIGDLALLKDEQTTTLTPTLLIVGNGKTVELTDEVAEAIVVRLGKKYRFTAGTPSGNPGIVLKRAAERYPQGIALYQPDFMKGETDDSFCGTPVVFVEGGKGEMRKRMINDATAVLALGGNEGTLHEVILALHLDKPVFMVKGWGPIPATLANGYKYRRRMPHMRITKSLVEAVQLIEKL
jgi:hypoxanthine phosphoribosyltransferase